MFILVANHFHELVFPLCLYSLGTVQNLMVDLAFLPPADSLNSNFQSSPYLYVGPQYLDTYLPRTCRTTTNENSEAFPTRQATITTLQRLSKDSGNLGKKYVLNKDKNRYYLGLQSSQSTSVKPQSLIPKTACLYQNPLVLLKQV